VSELLDLLGKNVASEEAQAVLAKYPALKSVIEDLGPGAGVEPAHYLRSERDGLLIKCNAEGEVRTIFLMSEGKDGFSQFVGDLPGGLTFESTPEEALDVFGDPGYRRSPGRIGQLEIGELLRFDLPDRSIHFQFRGDGNGVDLVTAMVAQSVPGRSHSQHQA
jgi:hypothetical protein